MVDSPVANQVLCAAVLLTGCQTAQKAVFKVTNTRGFLFLGYEMVQQIGYIHFLKITPPKLRQPPKIHTHLEAIVAKAPRHKKTSGRGQSLKCPRAQLLGGAVLRNGKRHDVCIIKEYILKEYHNVFSGIGPLFRDEYHIILKDNIPTQHPPRLVPVNLKSQYKKCSGGYAN